jgi:hypothetical protein
MQVTLADGGIFQEFRALRRKAGAEKGQLLIVHVVSGRHGQQTAFG